MAFVVVVAVLAPATASPQMGSPAGGDLFMDVNKAPVGSYGEYTMTLTDIPPVWMRYALVERKDGLNVLEISVKAQPGAPFRGLAVTQMAITGKKDDDDSVKRMVVQMGDGAQPMDMTPMIRMMPKKPKKKKAPAVMIGVETVRVPAGTFKAKHSRTAGSGGSTIETWTSDEAPPFGIVKMVAHYPPGTAPPPLNDATVPVTMELVVTRRGGDGHTAITGRVQPFDAAKLGAAR